MVSQISYGDSLKQEYRNLFAGCRIRDRYLPQVEIARIKVEANRERYETISKTSGVPWFVIGLIHLMESGCNFTKHLHNGDPLILRTTHVPAGRPPLPLIPPFTFEQSALDALKFVGFTAWHDWSLPGILWRLESYNGLGYRQYHPQVKTPYLWSYSNVYSRGKYSSDGHFSTNSVSQQPGVAVVLKRMVELGHIQLT